MRIGLKLFLLFTLFIASFLGYSYFKYTSSWFSDVLECRPTVRPDIATMSRWLAPIVWEGTFDLTVIDAIYKQQKHHRGNHCLRSGQETTTTEGPWIGGRPDKVLKLVKTCRMNLDVDRANKIEAVWQEESHLNKYFLYNKPTKLLSPEYLWDDRKGKPSFMKVVRFSQVEKNYAEIRPNP
ncbi:hypothetical protein KOW79_021673 [Hemibagrus wyckioides]|uniref:Uncharacterized protein n=1 Tax=Hemibagrus wyckioides TaxID=337641 RepID=A0A9D3N4J5_9TELE|nr:hypothetical protein KOW79_021673 [Hemibagrus wyckioides]